MPVRLQYNFNVQQQITPNTSITLGYVGSHSYHLIQITDPNQAIPQIVPSTTPGCSVFSCEYFAPGLAARNPQLGVMDEVYSIGDSSYQGLQINFAQRLSHGLRSSISYTWSKTMDDNAAGFDTALEVGTVQIPQQQQNNIADRGLSSYDVGRNLVINFTYDLPFNAGPQKLLKGWQVSAISILQDSTAFTPIDSFKNAPDASKNNAQRPNVVVGGGCSNNPVLGGPTQYYNPKCFYLPPPGFYGDLGRNTMIGPGFFNFDATLEKSTNITEKLKVLIRAEAFNQFNRADFALPNVSVFQSNRTYNPTAGQITSVVAPGRQLQLGLKFLF